LFAITEVWRRLSQLGQHQSDLAAKLAATHTETEEQKKRLAQASADRPAAELTLANATKAFQLAQTAASESVEHLRATLDAGTPCPVCGSTEHPYADADPGLRAALAALDANVVAAATQLDALKHAITAADTALAGLARTAVEIEREGATATDKINAASKDWQGCALSIEAPANPADREPWLTQMAEAQKTSLQALAAEEQTIHAAMKQRDNAQLAVDVARREVAAAQHRVAEATQAVLAARTAADAMAGKQNTLSAQRDGLLDQLDAAFAGADWRADWAADPGVFHRTAATEASQWLERDTQAKDLATTSSALATDVSHLAELRDTAVQRQHESKVRFDEIQRDLTGRTTALAELFGGRTADEVDAGLNASLLQAQTTLAAATESANQAGLALASAATSHTQASERYKSATVAVEKAEAALADWMIQRNAADRTQSVERATLESMLAFDADWITGERAALQTLDLAVGTATAVLKDRGEARQRHEVSRPTLETPEAISEQLVRGHAEVKAAADHQAMLKAQQLQDDQRRLQAEALAGEISAQEARARTWAQLNDMIGSADGRKFRNLAQQMTLDVLLGYANRHLTSLARRYRLERISDTLGLMVIDQDMADEVRSVHSLSGGESFLVSLALALGLASLSSHRVKVESLFIDEGFGSLDADSLRVAMEALDGLQAMGRKVGVISHVQEMTERIGTQIRVERHAGGRSSVSVVN
jgi:exonuclease SbcC